MKNLVTVPITDAHKAQLLAAAPEAEFDFLAPKNLTRDPKDNGLPIKGLTKELVHSYDVIIGNVSPALITGSPNLKWLQLNSAGTDGYTAPGVLADGVLLTNATGAYGLAISEHMIAALLMLMKNLHHYYDHQKEHLWKDAGKVISISGAKVLVVGAGNIGGDFARKMNALGAKVTGIRRHKVAPAPYLEASCTMEELDELLPQMDIVASCLPGTKETYHLFDEKRFGLMKEGSYFLNIGRGTAVDTLALTNALNSGHLAGASVDVTEPEPLPADSPLWDAKNVLVTPHISGGDHLDATVDNIVSIAAENLKAFLSGNELKNIVDFETGYRRFTGE